MSQRKRSLTSADHSSKEGTTSQVEYAPSSTQGPDSPLDEEAMLHYTRYPNRWSRIRYRTSAI